MATFNLDQPNELLLLMDSVLIKDLNMVEILVKEIKMKGILLNKSVRVKKSGKYLRHFHSATPLFAAVLDPDDPHHGIIDLLLKEGADVNFVSEHQSTVLIESAKRGLLQLLKKFINSGAKLDVRDQNGFTALHYAVKNNDFEMVKCIVASGCDVNVISEDKRTALHMSTSTGVSIEITEFLIENGANSDVLDENGETPLIRAVREDRSDVVRILLTGGSCVNIRNADSRSALHLAAASSLNSCLSICELLIAHGSYINACERYGNTPLSLCLSNNIGNRETSPANLLIKCGSQLNNYIVDDALAWAVTLENFDVVKLAINAGYNMAGKGWVKKLLNCDIGERHLIGVASSPLRDLKNFQEFLKNHLRNASTLQNLCRITIRNQLIHNGTRISIQFPIEKLPLPPCMKSFLMFEF